MLALVFAKLCTAGFVARVRDAHPDLLAYSFAPNSPLRTLAGKPVGEIGNIPATHVLWIGVPASWVEANGPFPFQSSFLGHPSIFRAFTDVEAALAQIQRMIAPTPTSVVTPHLPLILGEEPPWYIPEALA